MREEVVRQGERELGEVVVQLPRDTAILCCGGLRHEADRCRDHGNEVMAEAYAVLAEALYDATHKREPP